MSDNDDDMLALARVGPDQASVHVPGAVQITAGCGHQAWISPSGMLLLLSRKMQTICDDCVPAGPLNIAEVPGSREELQRSLPSAAADLDHVLDQLRTRGMRRRRGR